MGKVVKYINVDGEASCIDKLKKLYKVDDNLLNIKVENGNKVYKDVELNSILVNVEEGKDIIKVSKLVSLKAFLLSKEQGMDINDLLYNIDKVMSMSKKGLNKLNNSLVYNDELEGFLNKANISLIEINSGYIILNDGKRSVKVVCENKMADFNTILELT